MKKKRYITFFIIVIAISLFAFEQVHIILNNNVSKLSLFTQFLVNLPVCILIGFVDFFIINATYKNIRYKNDAIRVVVNLLLTNAFAVLLSVTTNYALTIFSSHTYDILRVSLPLILWNSTIVLLVEIFFYNQRQIEAERKMAIIEKEKIQYQYETLKAQINPHFLFNSLNVLSSLAYNDAEKTNLFAKKMSGVYRYLLLTNNKPTVTLKEELSFLKSYLFLEQIRFENALLVEISNSNSTLNREVIPVSLQLLVENAIKHNITTVNNPLIVKISITDKGIIVSNNLQLRSSVDKGGVGLKNLQKQYALHGKSIEVTETATDFIVTLSYINNPENPSCEF